jgi:hypothetical protein
MKILLSPDKPDDKGPSNSQEDPPAVAELKSKLDAANKKIVQLTIEKVIRTEDEKIIVEKMSKGLTRAQAVKIVERQKQYDASVIAQERAARKPGESSQRRADRLATLTAAADKKS